VGRRFERSTAHCSSAVRLAAGPTPSQPGTVDASVCSLTRSRSRSSVGPVACSVMCLSHTTGSGGDEIGKRVAERLGYLYLDEDIVARAAAEGGLEPRDIASEERRKSLASRFLEKLAEGGGDAWTLGA